MPKMKTQELEGLLSRLQNNAVGAFNASIGNHRADLMRRYLARPYGDEVKGRSKIVDTSIRDTIESIKPELMDIFLGGDRVVEFVPRGSEDIDGAQQETDVCNHLFMQENDGFMVLYNWITDALFQKTGYVKRYWEHLKRVEIEEYDELSPDEAAQLLAELGETSDEVEVLERSGGIDEETGEVSPLYLKIRRTNTSKKYRVQNVPPEELLIHPQWTRVDFKGCPYVAHKRPMTISEGVQMGFNKADLDDLPTYDKKLESEEAIVRWADEDFHETEYNNHAEGMREVLIYENYLLVDQDGDGIAEQLQVFTGGEGGRILKRGRKLAIEQVTDAPFEALCPLPIPHRHYGISVAELVEDLQKLKTIMIRQLADNVIGSNNPDLVYDENEATDRTAVALAETGIGRNIGIPGGLNSIGYLQTPSTAGESLAAIEYVDQLKENRSGVNRMNQGLDPNSISDLAQGTVKRFMTASQKKILMIARIFAETGYKSLFVNMHRDLRAGPVKELALRLNNEYVTVNPRTWRHRTDVTVNVGLGTGDRDIQLSRLMVIYGEQKEAFADGLIGYEKLYHTLQLILELSGYKDAQNFFPDPKEFEERMMQRQQQEQDQQDPASMLMQVEMEKVQQRAQADMVKAQIEQLKLMQQNQAEQTKRLEVLMKDDRERDIAAAKIEA